MKSEQVKVVLPHNLQILFPEEDTDGGENLLKLPNIPVKINPRDQSTYQEEEDNQTYFSFFSVKNCFSCNTCCESEPNKGIDDGHKFGKPLTIFVLFQEPQAKTQEPKSHSFGSSRKG